MNNVVRIKAGPLPHADTRSECRLSHDVTAEYMQIGAHRMQRMGDPGDEMQGFGGSGVVWIVSLSVLLPMAVWGVVALVRHVLGASA